MNSSLCLYVICIMLWLAVACQGIQCPLEVVVDFASLAHLCILVETLHSSHVMSLVISYMFHFCMTFILVINLGCSVCSIPSTSLFLMWKILAFFKKPQNAIFIPFIAPCDLVCLSCYTYVALLYDLPCPSDSFNKICTTSTWTVVNECLIVKWQHLDILTF